jgi:hypothetical protein
MSTRASIVISKCTVPLGEDPDKIILFHHCDGYPDGVGSELVDFLRQFCKRLSELNEFQSNFSQHNYDWSPETVAAFITDRDMSYRRITDIPRSTEYVYIIDTNKKRLSCHGTDGCSDVDLDCLGDRIELPDNIFDGRTIGTAILPAAPDVNYADMFKACSSVKSFDGENVVFQDGTKVPLSQISSSAPMDWGSHGDDLHSPASGFPGLLTPAILPPTTPQSRSYVEAGEFSEKYERIFLTVLPVIIKRAVAPMDEEQIITKANSFTCAVLDQFEKVHKNYLQGI